MDIAALESGPKTTERYSGDRTDRHRALQKGSALRRSSHDRSVAKIAVGSGTDVAFIFVDCCADDTAESHATGEHLDFAQVCCLMSAQPSNPGPSGKDADARRPTLRCRINCPAAGKRRDQSISGLNAVLSPDTVDLTPPASTQLFTERGTMTDRFRRANPPTTELAADPATTVTGGDAGLGRRGRIRRACRRSFGKRVRGRARRAIARRTHKAQRPRVPLTLTYDPESRAAGSFPQEPAAPTASNRVLQRRKRTPCHGRRATRETRPIPNLAVQAV